MPDASPELPGLAAVAATLVSFCEGSGAVGASVVIDVGEADPPVTVELDPNGGSLTVSQADELTVVPDVAAIESADPVVAFHLHSFPAFEVDLEAGTVTGAIGALEHQARSVAVLAAAFGGRSVAAVRYPTTIGEPIEIGASAGGEVALSCAGVEFEAPESWAAG